MDNTFTFRLDSETLLNLDIMAKACKTDKAKIVRMILKDFFTKNDQLLDQYYEKIKTR